MIKYWIAMFVHINNMIFHDLNVIDFPKGDHRRLFVVAV